MEREQDILNKTEQKTQRIATFERDELAKISLHYTRELMGHEQPALSKELADRFELGRRAFGHLRRRKVFMINKIDVYKTGSGIDDISVKVFMEEEKTT